MTKTPDAEAERRTELAMDVVKMLHAIREPCPYKKDEQQTLRSQWIAQAYAYKIGQLCAELEAVKAQSLDAYAERHQAEKGWPLLIVGREYLWNGVSWTFTDLDPNSDFVNIRNVSKNVHQTVRRTDLTWKKEDA